MDNTSKNKKRIFVILLLVVMGWSTLLYRLFVIQIRDTRDFSDQHVDLLERSVQQRKQEFVLSTGRGNIYDRNLDSLIERKEINTVIVFPFGKGMIDEASISALAKILRMDYGSLDEQINALSSTTYIEKNGEPIELTTEQQQAIEELQIPGVVAIPYTYQDYESASAKHVIGYLGQAPSVIEQQYQDYLDRGILTKNSLIGRSGLQMQYQELLMGVGESKIAYYVDSKGNPLNGLSSKYLIQDDPYYPLSLVTTLDKELQSIAEEQLQRYNIQDGSVVILDANNAEILAMASSPDFNLLNVNPNNNDWNNKAVQVIEPGSTYKTLIAIAGLEEGVVTLDEHFNCTGEIEEYHFSCHEAHGDITLEEAFAESCNTVFAEIAVRLGPEKIEEYAAKLGMVGTIGWEGEFFKDDSFKQIANEESNRVFHQNTNVEDPGSIMRTAIGQQDVRISPLAAANLVVTILNDGTVYEPKLVDSVVYKNGTDYYEFPAHIYNSNVGKESTYDIVRDLMEKVVDDGTGTLLNQAYWDLSGKSGTAETVNNLNHQWFIGYGPVDNPQYAMAVAVKNVSTSDQLAKKVFMGIMDELAGR